MIKICVFSDSHGSSSGMIRALGQESPGLCFFLGDGERDLEEVRSRFPSLAVYAVRGNCDLRSRLPVFISCSVEGVGIYACHGHMYEVKTDHALTLLKGTARRAGAGIVLYGHTHEARLENSDGLTIMNPGSIGRGRRPGYGLITIDRNTADCCLRKI